MTKYLYILFFTIIPFLSNGQYSINGTTVQNCNCFELNQDGTTNSIGSFNQTASIDLANSFNYKFTVNWGCDDSGGEGVAFVMQSGPWVDGNSGPGLGYEGISNSLAIEFDTRDNEASGENTLGDVSADHISIQQNGNIDHGGPNNLLGVSTVFNIINGVANVEDCQDHTVEIIWNSGAQTIDVLVDGGSSSFGGAVFVGDIVNNIFGGNSNVLWGWTGSTGVLTNTQTVCLALEPIISYSATNCPNQVINFTATDWSFNTVTTYLWDFDGLGTSNLQNPTFTFVTAGNHPITLTITDNTGCSNTETFDLGVGFDVNISATDTTICPNGSTQLQVTALPFVGNDCCFDLKLTDLFDDGWAGNNVEIFVDGTSIGTFAPAVNGAGGSYTEVFQLCFNQDAVVTALINGDQFPGECIYELVDQNGTTIIQNLNGVGVWVDGNTQSFTVDCGITPPTYTYLWDNAGFLNNATVSNPTATVPNTTTFTVDVTDPNTGCTIPNSFTVITSTPVTATISGNVTVCDGDNGDLTITFTGNGPYDVQYLDPLGNTNALSGITANPYILTNNLCGNYSLLSVVGDGCSGSEIGTGTITCIPLPNVDIEASATYCDGDVINPLNVVSTNGGTVSWYNNAALTGPALATGNSFTPPSTVGTVTYYAQEAEVVLGCTGASDNVTITINPIPIAPVISGVTEYCEGDTPTPLTAEMSLNGSASWYNNAALTLPTVSTLLQYNPTLNVGLFCYYVTETANGCTGPSTEICVNTKPTPTAPNISGNITYCEGETPTPLTATPTLGGIIDWYNTAATNINTGTNYTPDLTLGNQTFNTTETLNGCTSPPGTISITVNILPTVNIPESEQICFGDSVLVTAENNGFDLLWSNGDTLETSWLTPAVTSTIYITATNPLCGFVLDSILVTVFDLPNVTAGNDTVIGIGGEAVLWATGTNSFVWTPDVNECIESNCSEVYVIPNQATLYVVDGVDGNQCHNYDTVLVDISGYMDVFVPNLFSPNGDGINDYLIVSGPRLFNYQIEIFDRWGKLVFIANEQKNSWDGKLNGNDLSAQTFVYIIRGETVLGEKIKQTGNVTIIK